MQKLTRYIIILMSIFIICSQQIIAQGTSPVGVNFVLVNFNQPPTPSTLIVKKAPLKYNKDFALSFQVDDTDVDIYDLGFPVFAGGTIGGTQYPGFYYSDGCGNQHSFKMSAAIFIYSGSTLNGLDKDVLNPDNNYDKLHWDELDTLFQNGWGVQNHGINGGGTEVNYSVKRNKSYVRRNLYNSMAGGVVSHSLVNPNGNQAFTPVAFDNRYICAINQGGNSPIGNDGGGNVNNDTVDWTLPHRIGRRYAINASSFADDMASASTGGANYWGTIFTHNLSGTPGGISFNNFLNNFTDISSTYGINGLDNILMTTDEEIQDYLIVRDATTLNYTLAGTTLLITYSGEVPDNLLYYSSTIVINSDATITNITVDGATDYTRTPNGQTDALINLNWDGYAVIPAEVLADSMVTIGLVDSNQLDCWVAMDYVITMTNGSHKDSLRKLLCDIPNNVYDPGFCDCSISLQQTEITMCPEDCEWLLGAPGYATYEWWVDDTLYATSQDTIVCPTDTTTVYTQIATNTLGCPARDSILVNLDFLSFDLGPNDTVCFGDSVLLSGPSDMDNYEWYNGTTFIGDNQTLYVSPTGSTQYNLIVVDTNSCSAEDSIKVEVWPLPNVNLQPSDTIICFGDCILLSGPTGNYTYNWRVGDLQVGTAQNYNACPSDTTQYNLVVTDINGCSGEDSIMVNIDSLYFDLGPNEGVCFGDSVLLSGPSDMDTYRWYIGTTLIGDSSTIFVSPTVTTQYNLIVVDSNNCTAEDNITVNVWPLPIVNLQPSDTIICFGDCILLSGPTGNYTFNWRVGDLQVGTAQNYNACPSDTTQYNLIVTDLNGCSNEDSIMVNIDSLYFDLGPNDTICFGDSVLLSGPSGMDTYQWYIGNTFIGDNQTIYVSPTVATQYNLIVVDTNSCSAEDSITINVIPLPIVNLHPNDTTIINGQCIDLLGPTGNYTYNWYANDTLFSTAQDTSDCPLDTTQYNLIVTNLFGCSGEDSIMVNIKFLSFDLGPDTTICDGNCVTLSGPDSMAVYTWWVADTIFDTVQTINPCPINTTQYLLQVADTLGDTAQDSIYINVLPSPTVILPPDTTIRFGECIELSGPDSMEVYNWIVADTIYDTIQAISPCPLDTTQFKLIVTNSYGCPAEDSIMINIKFLSFSLGADTSICYGDCITIEGPPDMAEYLWLVADTIYSTVQVINPCPLIDTQYKLWVMDTLGGTAEDSIFITVRPTPTVSFEEDSLYVCEGNNILLTVIGSPDIFSFNWYYNGLYKGTTFTNTYILENTDTSGYVSVEAAQLNNCRAFDTAAITILPYPEIFVSNDTTICSGQPVTLTVSGGTIFRWILGSDTISTNSTIIVNPEITTSYIAQTAFSDSMCFSESNVTVTVHNSATTKILYDTNVVCTYQLVTLTGSGADHYLWTPSGDTNQIYTFQIFDTTTIWLTGTTFDGCQLTDSATFYTKPSPQVSFTGLLPAYCENDTWSQLTGTPINGIFFGPGIVGDKFYPQSAGPGTHNIVYSYVNLENCVGYDTNSTIVYPNDGLIDLGPNFTIPPQDSAILDAGPGFDNYYWNTGAITQSIVVYGDDKSPGTYEYAVIGVINGCSTKGRVYITFEKPDGYDEQHINDLIIYPNPNKGSFTIEFSSVEKNIQLRITNIQGISLYENDNVSCNAECKIDVQLVGIEAGVYILQITTQKGVSTGKIILK